MERNQNRNGWKKALRISGLTIISLIVLLIITMLIITSITPAPLITILQKTGMVSGEVNSMYPKSQPTKITISDRILYISEIQYAKKYPNSYLDIYVPNGDTEIKRPTFFFVHGGGYAWGDKAEGDPRAKQTGEKESPSYLEMIAENGFNVVSINYVLTPDYLYPTPLYQIDEAIKFLQNHGDSYGIDMNNIIFCGSSAGGQLVGQYVNIQTNPKYAEEMGIASSVKKESIKAVVFNSALLDSTRFGKTDHALTNYLFDAFGRLYFKTNELENNSEADQSNVIRHLSTNFPPTFITDGNTATFTDQAEDLDKRMTDLKIPHVFNYYDKNVEELKHGYERALDNKHANENMSRMFDFLHQHIDIE